MKPDLKNVILSFGAVALVLALGDSGAQRTVVAYKYQDTARQANEEYQKLQGINDSLQKSIADFQKELKTAHDKQKRAENLLAQKLAEEERIALAKARAIETARRANLTRQANAARAEAARIAAKKAKSKSKKSKAS